MLRILKDSTDITDEIFKFSRIFTENYIPKDSEENTLDIVETFAFEYTKGSEDSISIRFPPQTTSDNFTIYFESVDELDDDGNPIQLNGETETFTEDRIGVNVYLFNVRISGTSLDILDGDIRNHIFNREFVVTTTSSQTTLGFYFTFEASPTSVHFESGQTTKRSYIRLYGVNAEEPELRDVIPPGILPEGVGNTGMYTVTFSPAVPESIQRTRPIKRGYGVDSDNPNAFVIDFERTDFSNDVDDRYEVTFNREGFLDAVSNPLMGQSIVLLATSQPQVQEELEYITRITYDNEEVSTLDFTAFNGQIDIPNIGVQLYRYLPSEGRAGATRADDDFSRFYMLAELQGFSGGAADALYMNGEPPSDSEGLFGTKRWGPFDKGSTIELRGEMDSTATTSKIILKSYAELTEPGEGGIPRVSQLDVPLLDINLTADRESVDPPPIFQPPTKLYTLNISQVDLVRIDELLPGGSLRDLPEEQWTWERLFELPPDYPIRVFRYEFGLEPPSTFPMLDSILQFRKVYDNGDVEEWKNVPSNSGEYARLSGAGIEDFSSAGVIRLTSAMLANQVSTIQFGLIPFYDATSGEFRGNSSYQFRTVAIEFPTTERSPQPDGQFLMFGNPGGVQV